MSTVYDVTVIGAGVVGAAIARALAGFELKVLLLDSRSDIGDGTSKANTAILHTGFDATPGTLESRLVHRGYELLRDYCAQAQIPLQNTSALLVAWDHEQLESLPTLQAKAAKNGYPHTQIVTAEQVYATAPELGPGALGGLVVPGESIICPWSTTLAFATEAVRRGAELCLNTRVRSAIVEADFTVLTTDTGTIQTRWVVNAAGLGGDTVEAMFGFERFHLHPRRGELLVFDKLAAPKAPVILLPVPSKLGKGVLISPTIYGNVMLGPTAEDMEDRSDTATTEAGFEFLRSKGEALMPSLLTEEVSAAYAGLRAAHDQSDYVIEADTATRYLVAGCIRSTGLTSSMAVAEHVVELLHQAGLGLTEREQLPPTPIVPPIGEHQVRPYADADKIAADPQYGTMVCFCERVSAGEIRDALHSEIPATDLGGLRRRTRAHNGRCQGFFCGARLTALLKEADDQARNEAGR